MSYEYLLLIPNYYAIENNLADCYSTMRRISGRTRTSIRMEPHILLKFPPGSNVTVSPLDGSWTSEFKPVELVECLAPSKQAHTELTELCKKGAAEHKKRVDLAAAKYADASGR